MCSILTHGLQDVQNLVSTADLEYCTQQTVNNVMGYVHPGQIAYPLLPGFTCSSRDNARLYL